MVHRYTCTLALIYQHLVFFRSGLRWLSLKCIPYRRLLALTRLAFPACPEPIALSSSAIMLESKYARAKLLLQRRQKATFKFDGAAAAFANSAGFLFALPFYDFSDTAALNSFPGQDPMLPPTPCARPPEGTWGALLDAELPFEVEDAITGAAYTRRNHSARTDGRTTERPGRWALGRPRPGPTSKHLSAI